jgi:hypothetical protein
MEHQARLRRRNKRPRFGDVQRGARYHHRQNERKSEASARFLHSPRRSHDDHHQLGYLVYFHSNQFHIHRFIFPLVSRISPIGVFFLVAAKIMEIKSFQEIVGQLGMYFMTVLVGLFLHGFGTLTILFFIITRKLPFSYLAQMGQVLATAFGTASR